MDFRKEFKERLRGASDVGAQHALKQAYECEQTLQKARAKVDTTGACAVPQEELLELLDAAKTCAHEAVYALGLAQLMTGEEG